MNTDASKAEKKSFFLLWWKTDPEEIEKQVSQYGTLKIYQSARGLSLLLCLVSVAATILLSGSMTLSSGTVITEAVVWSSLGFFMYRGHRWAFVTGMVIWTLEKAFMLFSSGSASAPFVQVIWWAIYMNAFFLGFKVERRRRTVIAVAPAGA